MLLTSSIIEDDIKVLSLAGRMDLTGSREIDASFSQAMTGEAVNIIVDLSGVEFMASVGIGLLVRAANTLLLGHGKIVLMGPRPQVQNALEATFVHKVIPIVNDIESAKSYLKKLI